MYCCSNCFSDFGIRNIIESIAKTKGNCPICGSKSSGLAESGELIDHFQPLFDLYSNNPSSERSLKITTPVFLYQHLNLFWPGLFNSARLNDASIHQLVRDIAVSSDSDSRLFSEAVELTSYLNNDPALPAEGLELKWDYFASEIKTSNRFFLNEMINTELLESIFERLATVYPTGTEFYRARLSDHLLPPDMLLKPPAALTKAGRANPVGIPYLYLSSDLKTTLFETRISLHETLTIGKFILGEPLSLVSLKNIKDLGPFEVQEKRFELDEFITYRPYLQKLETELSKPVRKQDVDLDYLPTQFLCEFIKSLGFDAVEYKSAMNPDGFNLAVFNDQKLICEESKYYSVNRLEYEWKEL